MNTHEQTFKKMFWSYLLFIIFPFIVVGVLTVHVLFARLAEDTKALNIRIFEQTQNIIDKNINYALGISSKISSNQLLKNLISDIDSSSKNDPYILWSIKKELEKYYDDSSIYSIAIYLKNKNVVLTQNSVYTLREYYELCLKESGDSYDVWETRLKTGRVKSYFTSSQDNSTIIPKDIVIICNPIYNASSDAGGVFIAQILQETMLSHFPTDEGKDRKSYAALNEEGRPILKTEKFDVQMIPKILERGTGEYTIGKKVVFCRQFDNLSLKHVIVHEKSGLVGNVNYITVLFIILLLFGLIASATIAKFGEGHIEKPILAMVDENIKLNENLKEQIQYAREKVIINLLYGVEQQDEWASELVEKYGLGLTGSIFQVVTVGITGNKPLDSTGLDEINYSNWRKMSDILPSMFDDYSINYQFVCISTNYFFVFSYNEPIDLIHIVTEVMDRFCKKTFIPISIGIGEPVKEINKISLSFEKAATAFRISQLERPGEIITYQEIEFFRNDKLYYTKEKETSLVRNITSGSVKNVSDLLDELYNINFCNRHLNSSKLKRLIIHLVVTLYNVIDSIYDEETSQYAKYDRVLQNILRNENIEYGFAIIREVCFSLCNETNLNNNKESIKQKIIKYIDEKYMDYNLSLEMIADYMGMNYYYFSRFFKELIGTNFTNYLTDVRMKKASELLEKEYSVGEVSQMVGFSESNSFIRAFKKYYGVTPGRIKTQ